MNRQAIALLASIFVVFGIPLISITLGRVGVSLSWLVCAMLTLELLAVLTGGKNNKLPRRMPIIGLLLALTLATSGIAFGFNFHTMSLPLWIVALAIVTAPFRFLLLVRLGAVTLTCVPYAFALTIASAICMSPLFGLLGLLAIFFLALIVGGVWLINEFVEWYWTKAIRRN